MAIAPMIVALLAVTAAPDDQPITVTGYPWAPFISPMGEPFRGGPNREAPIARWFAKADRNRDGVLTLDEAEADADRFFARLDRNHDKQIDREEMVAYEAEIAPEIQVNSDWRRPRGQVSPAAAKSGRDDRARKRRNDSHDGYHVDGLQGAARYGLLNIPQPVASADADFNRAVSLAEFRQAASSRFRLLDSSGQGRIALQDLEARLPTRPEGRRAKPRKNALDTRIGQPLPKGD